LASARVYNLTTRCYHKLSQAQNWISDGSHAWVVQLKTIRVLSLQERVAKRSEIARQMEIGTEILVPAELPETHFHGPANPIYPFAKPAYEELSEVLAVRKCRWPRTNPQGTDHLVRAANQFAESAA